MWMTLLSGVMKRPWIIALVVMTIALGGMWVKINLLKGDIVDLQRDVAQIQSNFDTCKSNEADLLSAIDTQNGSIDSLNTIITALQDQVIAEQETSAEWERKYLHRPIIERVKEVPVIQYVEKGVVVDEETSKEYVNYFNILFGTE